MLKHLFFRLQVNIAIYNNVECMLYNYYFRGVTDVNKCYFCVDVLYRTVNIIQYRRRE